MNCPICDSNEVTRKVAEITSVWASPYDVSRCHDCSLYFLPRQPSDAEMRQYYQRKYYEKPSSSLRDACKTLFRQFRSYSQHAEINDIIHTPGKRILEVGCAEGMLLRLFKQDGSVVYGTEYSAKMLDLAVRKHRLQVEDADFFNLRGQYDLIVMSHVLEHFKDIHQVVSKLHDLLARDGAVFIEVPYSPLASEADPEALAGYLNTTHMVNFRPANLARLFEDHGFTVTVLKRSFYRLPSRMGAATKRRLGECFMLGCNPGLRQAGRVAGYLLGSMLSKRRAFETVPENTPWIGMGDNIRLIAIKREQATGSINFECAGLSRAFIPAACGGEPTAVAPASAAASDGRESACKARAVKKRETSRSRHAHSSNRSLKSVLG